MKTKILTLALILLFSINLFAENKNRIGGEIDYSVFYLDMAGGGLSNSITGQFQYNFLNNNLTIGIGTGLEYLRNNNATLSFGAYSPEHLNLINIPVFISPKYSPKINESLRFIIGLDLGNRFFTKKNYDYYKSFFATPKIGLAIKANKITNKYINIHVTYNSLNYKAMGFKGSTVGLSIGYSF